MVGPPVRGPSALIYETGLTPSSGSQFGVFLASAGTTLSPTTSCINALILSNCPIVSKSAVFAGSATSNSRMPPERPARRALFATPKPDWFRHPGGHRRRWTDQIDASLKRRYDALTAAHPRDRTLRREFPTSWCPAADFAGNREHWGQLICGRSPFD